MNIRKGTYWFVGTSAVLTVALPVAWNFGPGLTTRIMSGDFSLGGAIKWSSIVAGAAVALYFLVSRGVLANENLEEGERGYRRRWGKIVANRKTGKRKLLLPGKKHFYIKHMYDVVVQSVRVRSTPEEPDLSQPLRATLGGMNLWIVLVIDWYVEDIEESIYKSLTQVYQVRRAQEGSDALANYVTNQVNKTVVRHLADFDTNPDHLPVITIDLEVGSVPDALLELLQELHDKFGVVVNGIDPILLTQAPEEAIRGIRA